MSTYSKLKTDENLELRGITLDLGEAGKFVVARAGGANKSFAKTFQKVTRPYRRAIQTEVMDEQLANQLLVDVYVDCVLLGWSGVTDEQGNALSYNRENAKKLLRDLPQLFEEIRRTAEDAALFRQDILEKDAGNSVPS